MWTESPVVRDAGAAVLTGVAAGVVLRFWEEIASRGLLEQKLCRKLVHITVGLVYFLMWPLFRYMCYLSIFGFVDKSWNMIGAFGVISLGAAVVESLPISTRLDDNLTVPLTSVVIGALAFYIIGATNLCCMSISEDSRSVSEIVEMVFAG